MYRMACPCSCTEWHVHVHVQNGMYMFMYKMACTCTCTECHVYVHVQNGMYMFMYRMACPMHNSILKYLLRSRMNEISMFLPLEIEIFPVGVLYKSYLRLRVAQ